MSDELHFELRLLLLLGRCLSVSRRKKTADRRVGGGGGKESKTTWISGPEKDELPEKSEAS